MKPWMSKLTRHLIFNMLNLKIHKRAWLLDVVTLVSFVKQLTGFKRIIVSSFSGPSCPRISTRPLHRTLKLAFVHI